MITKLLAKGRKGKLDTEKLMIWTVLENSPGVSKRCLKNYVCDRLQFTKKSFYNAYNRLLNTGIFKETEIKYTQMGRNGQLVESEVLDRLESKDSNLSVQAEKYGVKLEKTKRNIMVVIDHSQVKTLTREFLLNSYLQENKENLSQEMLQILAASLNARLLTRSVEEQEEMKFLIKSAAKYRNEGKRKESEQVNKYISKLEYGEIMNYLWLIGE